VTPRIIAQINTIGSHRILVKNSKRGGMGGVGRCLGGIGHLAALMRRLHFLLVLKLWDVAHFPALRAFFFRCIDACRALVSSWVTCLASLAAYAGAKGFGSCDVMIVFGAFLVFLSMALLQRSAPKQLSGSGDR
jgi:hypothetical protein